MRGLKFNIGRLRLHLVRWVPSQEKSKSRKFFRSNSYKYRYVRHWVFNVGRYSLSVLWRG